MLNYCKLILSLNSLSSLFYIWYIMENIRYLITKSYFCIILHYIAALPKFKTSDNIRNNIFKNFS